MRNETVTNHYKHNVDYPINFTWPDKVNYYNPIKGLKLYGYSSWYFKLQSGEKTNEDERDYLYMMDDLSEWADGFEDLNWSEINSIEIIYSSTDLSVTALWFNNPQN